MATIEKQLKVSEIPASAWIELHGIPSSLELRGTRAVFVFPANDVVYRLLNEFNEGGTCSAIDLTNKIRELNRRLHSVKAGAL